MFRFLLVASALGHINKYFHKEASEQDFWTVPEETLSSVKNLERTQTWYMINPQILKPQYVCSNEALVITEEEKQSMIQAFALLHDYSKNLPDSASLQERILMTKSQLPPVFFNSSPKENECKVIQLTLPVK